MRNICAAVNEKYQEQPFLTTLRNAQDMGVHDGRHFGADDQLILF